MAVALYRLKYAPKPGGKAEPVNDETYIHASTARRDAQAAAKAADRDVLILNGTTVRYRIKPDGSTAPPASALVRRADKCTAGQGPGACFCSGCRARRGHR